MASNGDRALAKAVTTYLLNTTELWSQPNLHAVWAVMNNAVIVRAQPRHNPDAHCVVTSTGSVAELYIDPLAQCFGDYDTMYHFSDMLAIPAGHPLPIRLPADFHDDVNVYEIDDSAVPGYVYLVLRYKLRRCDDDDEDGVYSWSKYEEDDLDNTYLLHGDGPMGHLQHGPAVVMPISNILNVITEGPDELDSYIMSLDWVFSVRCLVWPPQAAGWPGRVRQHGSPDPSTVDIVVADGCHLVPVAHHLCRDNVWVGNRQWRLSFSKAELQLINRWTPIQQLVYHVLRSVMKIAEITTEGETTVISNYHIKTVMLWATELHPAAWWNTGDSCIITAAASLLDTLSRCLTQRYCQHYFVDDANLFLLTAAQSLRVESVLTKLRSISDVNRLATMLFDKYVTPCVLQACPDDVVRLFYNVGNLDEALSAVTEWRRGSLRERSWRALDSCSHGIERCICEISLTPRSCRYFVERLGDEDNRLVVHFLGFACLHVAYTLATGNTRKLRYSDQLLDVLSVLFRADNVSTCQHGNSMRMTKATALMKAVAQKLYERCNVERLVLVELSKAYLSAELQNGSSSSSTSEFCLANVYLAAMYYDEMRYEMAIAHCQLAQRSEAQRQSEHVVQVELLPRIKDVNSVLGVVVLYQFIRAGSFSRQQHHGVYLGIFTAHLFASFLHVICLRQRSESGQNLPALSGQLRRYRRRLLDCEQPLISDILLFKLTAATLPVRLANCQSNNHQCSGSLPTWNSSELVGLLIRSAVERLTTFREIQTRDFGVDVVPGTTDFQAMYAFRRGCYVDCMRLCQRNIENLADYDVLQEIFLLPEFIFLLEDCDLVSVIGLALMVVPEARYDPQWQFVFRLSQLSLALYLYSECQLRLRHSARSLRETQLCANLAGRRHPPYATLNTWTLQLISRKITQRLNDA